MYHTESIMELKNIIHAEFIEKIISLIKSKSTEKLTIDDGVLKEDVRNVYGYHLDFKTPTNVFYWNFIKKEIERIFIFYKSKFPKIESTKINQIDLLRYEIGGKYEVHTDYHTSSSRELSVILNLNDDYEGGDLVFYDQKENEVKRLKLGKGSIIFFPSNFMYPHMIEPITKGTRYSIVAWLQ